ncbi:sensor domain-containing protein [candidate division CSSED10-310 bacterium]|uniref:Sensor domain-containing protein n=1 Tax=candidate division CSSED10-310 bacterium TaxID=2855610 RepID=A0ABV6YW60_UNCC1
MTRDKTAIIQDYINQLTAILEGSDPALIMDATNDAHEYLYNEIDTLLGANPDLSIADAAEQAITKFGSPAEVASAFQDMESQVKRAFSYSTSKPKRRFWARFFSITMEHQAYSSLFYMLLSLFTGIIYGVWILYGTVIALVSSIFVIGIPICLLFLASLRAFALVESRLIESLLGMRMPRRPVFSQVAGNTLTRLWAMLKDSQTWRNWLYLLLMLPLGLLYGVTVLAGLTAIMELLLLPFFPQLFSEGESGPGIWFLPFSIIFGLLILTLLLHLVRYVTRYHARFAKYLLVGGSKKHGETE